MRFAHSPYALALGMLAGAPLAAQTPNAPAATETAPLRPDVLLPGDNPPPGLERMLRPPRPQPPGGQPPAPADTTLAPPASFSADLAQAVVNTCLSQGLRVGVAVADVAGNLRYAAAADGAGPGTTYTAARKASAVVGFGGLSTAEIQAKLRVDRKARDSVKPYMAVFPGGRPLWRDGKLIGAVAASGGTGEQDDACVQSGIAAIAKPASAMAGVSALSPAQVELLAAEDARFKAQIAKDVQTVSSGLADDLTYVHAVGRRQTKADYLAALASGKADYRSITPSERGVQVSGMMGWTRAILNTVVGDHQMQSSYLATYTKRDGRWQLVSWQTTPSAPPAEAPPAVRP